MLNKILFLFIFPCAKITRLTSESFEQPTSWLTRLRVRVHLAMCAWCRRFVEQLQFLRQAVRTHPDRLESQEDPPPHSLSNESRQRLKQMLNSRIIE